MMLGGEVGVVWFVLVWRFSGANCWGSKSGVYKSSDVNESTERQVKGRLLILLRRRRDGDVKTDDLRPMV